MKTEWMGIAKERVGQYVLWGLAGAVAVFLGLFAWSFVGGEVGGGIADGDSSQDLSGCNVVGITVHGCVMTYAPAADEGTSGVPEGCDAMTVSEDVMLTLQEVSTHKNVKAVLLDIDSMGGAPQGAVEIEQAVQASGLPSVAWIRGYGDSAAYWIASAADTIIASEESDIGSIGVTSSYTDNSRQNATEGITYNSISTGKYKDMGSPDKPLTAEERTVIEKGLRITLDHFIETIATNRELSVEKVRALADGSSWLGKEALSLGLIDELGTYPEVMDTLKEITKDEPVICWQ
jgi:signal peptide peptidase SppA